MNSNLCPVADGFLACTLQLLSAEDEQVLLRIAMVECFGGRVLGKAEDARARHLVQYATKTCLPRAFAMFRLPYGAEVLSALPDYTASTHEAYFHAIDMLLAQEWGGEYAGGTLMRDSLQRPLAAVQRVLALIASNNIAQVCETLSPLFERLSASEDLLPVLDELLRITPEQPYRPQPRKTATMPGLSFGFASAIADAA